MGVSHIEKRVLPPPQLGHFFTHTQKNNQNIPLLGGSPDGGKRLAAGTAVGGTDLLADTTPDATGESDEFAECGSELMKY